MTEDEDLRRLRDEVAKLKLQCKTLRQRLRREQADHQQTLKRLEVIRAAMSDRGET